MENIIDFFKNEDNITKKMVEGLYNEGFTTINDFVLRQNEILSNPGRNKKKFIAKYLDLKKLILEKHPELKNNNIPQLSNTENKLTQMDDKKFNHCFILPEELSILNSIKISSIAKSGYIDSKLISPLTNKTLADIYFMSEDNVLALDKMGKNKLTIFNDFQNDLRVNSDKYIKYYNNNVAITELPRRFDANCSLSRAVFSALKDLSDLLRYRNDFKSAEILDLYYGLNTDEPIDRVAIGVHFGNDEERIRQIIFSIASLGLKNLFAGEVKDRVIINTLIVLELQNIKKQAMLGNNFKSLVAGDENISNLKLFRIAELINCDIIDDIDNQIYLVKSAGINKFRQHSISLNQIIKREIIPINHEKISELTGKYLKKNTTLSSQIILQLLNSCSIIEKFIDEIGDAMYQCKWEFLASDELKLKRILFDGKRPMTKQEMIEEYNHRAVQANAAGFTNFNIKQDEDFKLSGGNGNWVYVRIYDGKGIDVEQSITQFISQFLISQDGKAYLQDVINAINEIGIFKHTVGTIRATLLNVSSQSRKDKELFIHYDFENQYPDIELQPNRQKHLGHKLILKVIDILKGMLSNSLPSTELTDLIISELAKDGITILKGNCIQYIRMFLDNDDSVLSERTENGVRYISLNNNKLKVCNLETIGKEKEDEHITTIRAYAVKYLKEASDLKATLKEILSSIKVAGLFPEHLKSDSIFYKTLNDSKLFEKYTIGNDRFLRLRPELLPVQKSHAEEVVEEIVNIVETRVDEIPSIVLTNEQLFQPNYYQRPLFDWNQIKAQFSKELSHFRFNDEILEKGVDAFYNALQINNQIDFWGKQMLQTLSNLWFCQTDGYDRHIYLKTLINDYETYLKRFYTSPNNTTGLATVIESFIVMNELRKYDDICNSNRVYNYDSTKQSFSKIINRLVSFRNKSTHNASHPVFDMGFSSQIKNSTDFIALYIYTGYLLGDK